MTTNTGSSPYNWRWRRARERFLARHPLCARHQRMGMVVAATVVDHIEPHRGDQKLFWRESNWQALCASCHSSWKQALEAGHLISGADASGTPTDPRHHWSPL
jgi:5-methylcytosine-specific restriction enzyme A